MSRVYNTGGYFKSSVLTQQGYSVEAALAEQMSCLKIMQAHTLRLHIRLQA